MFQDGSDSGLNQFLGSFPHPFRGQLAYVPEFASLCMISRTFHSLFKVLFIFPSRYLFAIGLRQIFSFRRILPPTLCCSPKQHDSQDAHCNRSQPARNTSITFFGRLSQQPFTRQRYLQIRTSRPQFPRHKAGDFRIELFPLHSPLLGESLLVSFPPLSNMFKFSGSSYLSSALE